MSDRSQLLKGILEGCILKVIHDHLTYGYEIVEKLRDYGFNDACEGTVYPLLLRLEKNGQLIASKKASPLGPMRKYYSLTDVGLQELTLFRHNWAVVARNVDNILQDNLGGIGNESIHSGNVQKK
ncbi:PadR family transcriptional regulator [Paenibacillus sp. SI8]|uniref:PadR family transcriptional regulator n=1 Tax=unclassified Paenibacillus TaxID=185978 RepID=UPI003466F476